MEQKKRKAPSKEKPPKNTPKGTGGLRNFLFTHWDVEKPLNWDLMAEAGVKYLVYQLEKAPETGKLHYQGYIESKNMKFTTAKKLPGFNNETHLEARRGTREQAREYCMKSDTRVDGPWEFGEFKGQQGARHELYTVLKMTNEGKSNKEIYEECPVGYARNYKTIDHIRQMLAVTRNFQTEVYVIWGDTNLGKTKWAVQQSPGAYMKQRCAKHGTDWWGKYDGVQDVIIDDFYGWIMYDTMLRLCDRYPMEVEVKGGERNFASKRIYITSNIWPDRWWKGIEDIDKLWPAFARRVTKWMYFTAADTWQSFDTWDEVCNMAIRPPTHMLEASEDSYKRRRAAIERELADYEETEKKFKKLEQYRKKQRQWK